MFLHNIYNDVLNVLTNVAVFILKLSVYMSGNHINAITRSTFPCTIFKEEADDFAYQVKRFFTCNICLFHA